MRLTKSCLTILLIAVCVFLTCAFIFQSGRSLQASPARTQAAKMAIHTLNSMPNETKLVQYTGMQTNASATLSAHDAWISVEYQNPSACPQPCGYAGHSYPVFEHWNGHMWSSVNDALPNNYVHLYAMSALSSTNVWAVGEYEKVTPGNTDFFVEHWNGQTWTQPSVAYPSNDAYSFSRLTSIIAFSPYDIDVFGTYASTQQDSAFIAEHWNGISWSIAS